MHCQSCVKKLTNTFQRINGVESVVVTLDPPEARVEGTEVNRKRLAEAVSSAGDYSLGDTPEKRGQLTTDVKSNASLGTYYPLILIVTFIFVGCAILQVRAASWSWMHFMSDFMGGFFLVFGFFKLLDLRGFADAYQTYDVIAAKSRGYGFVYPFIEVALGMAYLMRFELLWTSVLTLVVMFAGSIGVLRSLLQKQSIQCACLGTVFDLPMTTVTLVEDLGMAVMAAAMIAVPLLQ